MTAQRPTRTGATSVAFAPTVAPSPTNVRSHLGARGNAAREWRTLVNRAPDPTKTSLPTTTPSHMHVRLWMRALDPTTPPPATKQNAPTPTSSPTLPPSDITDG